MGDKELAFDFIKTCYGQEPPAWATPNDYGLTRWEDIYLYNGSEIRYKTHDLFKTFRLKKDRT